MTSFSQSSASYSFFSTSTSTSQIYTLSLHDALPIFQRRCHRSRRQDGVGNGSMFAGDHARLRSEEHTSELQSLTNLVCRLLLEKKKISRALIRRKAE